MYYVPGTVLKATRVLDLEMFLFDKKSFQKMLYILSIYGANAFVRISIFARLTYWDLFLYGINK